MKLDIDQAAMRDYVSAAILNAITSEQRENLIKEAIASLLEPLKNEYGRDAGKTRLQEQFRQAVWSVARDVIEKQLKEDVGVQEGIKALVTKAFSHMVANDYELANNISHTLSQRLMEAMESK